MTATAIAGVIGGPLAAGLQSLDGFGGLRGWQWIFLVEGIPSIVLGFIVLGYLTDYPEQARWLSPDERSYLIERLRAEREEREQRHGFTLAQAFSHRVVLLL